LEKSNKEKSGAIGSLQKTHDHTESNPLLNTTQINGILKSLSKTIKYK